MIDTDRLLADTKKQVIALVEDLRVVATADPEATAHVASEYQRAHAAGRTAMGQAEWAEGLYAQVAVAWVLGCVLVRFCEDNELIDDPLLGGPGIRSHIALDHRAAHLQANPADDDRHWLREVFARLRSLPATGDIFGAHNPVWADDLMPSADGARKLREELTRLDPDTGELRHDFTDPSWDTRFLGDLYQDLSEHAKKTYALLQTPIFVEEFILDRTLDPAIATFGLAETTVIDPTCGSGHFLLGAFSRLFNRWVDAQPATNRRELARRTLDAIGGIDLNPFAASIARFRLLVAALQAGGDTQLANAPAYKIAIAVGDALLHGDPPGALPGMHVPGEEEALVSNHGYESEDVDAVRDLFRREWTVVVGNPPYIVVRDSALNYAYRARFSTCYRQYSLGVPFTQRFWQLARNDNGPERAGYVGMITANSFMKREFGKRLVENWVPQHDVTHVLDAGGAYIPGHGTPTVVLFGRNRPPAASTVRAVLGIRGEPSKPTDPAKGLVWSSIVELVDDPGAENSFVSVVDIKRDRLSVHPWSIGGGGAAELKDLIDRSTKRRLADKVMAISGLSYTRLDDAYFANAGTWKRFGILPSEVVPVGTGEDIRDWMIDLRTECLFPYDSELRASASPPLLRLLWLNKTALRQRRELGGLQEEVGLTWFEWNRFLRHHYRTPLAVPFANVATHNNFVLSTGGTVFNAHAPVIKLREEASEDDYLELLGPLNCSVSAFWFRQVFFPKPSNGVKRGLEDEAWETRLEFDATKLKQLPLPSRSPADVSRMLADVANSYRTALDELLDNPNVDDLDGRICELEALRATAIGFQEALDWQCYASYGLAENLTLDDEVEPPLALGQRAFEIWMARRIRAGELDTSWFTRHGSEPVPELPGAWSERYRSLVERRINIIDENPAVALLERPEHKRRWLARPIRDQVHDAMRVWLARRLEDERYWAEPAAIATVARLTAEARGDEAFVAVARLYAGRDDVDVAALIADIVSTDSVPYLAAYRYTDTGLRKYRAWLETWELQRREEGGEDVGSIAVPPKYGKPDFTGAGWELRGRLDVPKERFISYPGAERETDASMVIGWAGWNHLDRARALAAWYLQARRDGRDAEHLTPLLAGLAELVPWLKQWYDEPNTDPALNRPGTQISALVDTEMRSLGLTAQDVTAWRPEKTRSGRPRKATT